VRPPPKPLKIADSSHQSPVGPYFEKVVNKGKQGEADGA